MTLSVTDRIADAVAAEINSAVAAESFETLGFTAESTEFDWDRDFKRLKDLVVEVVSSSLQPEGSVELVARGHLGYEVKVDVVVLKRFEASDYDQNTGRLHKLSVRPMRRLVQQILNHFIGKRDGTPLDSEPDAKWVGAQPHWTNRDLLREGVFHGAVRLTFSTKEAI